MISGIHIVNKKGEVLLSRLYRDDVKRSSLDTFRTKVIRSKNVSKPVTHIDGASFLFTPNEDLFLVASTKQNANPALVFQFLFRMVEVFDAFFGGKFDENHVRENFVVIYEILDETMDFGYPQLTAVTMLSKVIRYGAVKEDNSKNKGDSGAKSESITSEITGAVDWRQPGKYKYRKNEVYIDVLESINLLMSSKNQVLRSDVSGKVMMKAWLTGMPECKFGMNDKLVMEKEVAAAGGARKPRKSGIAIDDVSFHRCVRLGKFDKDRTISFIPPDGEFELMKYRITQHVKLPFRVIPLVTEHGRSRVSYEIKIKSTFVANVTANNVIIKIPTPHNTAKCKMNVSSGKVKYHPEHQAMVWKIRRFPGDSSYILKGEARLLASLKEKAWSRPPIEMEFQVPMFMSSGLHVRFLKVFERGNYQTIKWVRYITRAGQYQIRI